MSAVAALFGRWVDMTSHPTREPLDLRPVTRVLIVDPYYPSFLHGHYAAHPELAEASYADQWQALMEQRFGTNDAYSHHLRALGIEAHEVVANCAPLQNAWLRENGVRVSGLLRGRLREKAIVVAQARRFEADIVYVQNMRWVLGSTLGRLRKVARRIVGQIASEPPKDRTIAKYDLVLTSFPHYVDDFRALGVASEPPMTRFLARELATAMGATLDCRSTLGVGSGYYGAFPIELAVFGDGGLAWDTQHDPSVFGSGSRDPVFSAGAGLRINLLGFAIAEVDLVRPFDRPGKGWVWQFELQPGF